MIPGRVLKAIGYRILFATDFTWTENAMQLQLQFINFIVVKLSWLF